MSGSPELLLIDAGAQPLHALAARLKRLGYRTIQAKTPGEAHEILCDPRRRIGAVMLPPDLPVPDLGRALDSLRSLGGGDPLGFLAAGPKPDGDSLEVLRRAGVSFGLWDPVDTHTLRFLVNFSLASEEAFRRARGSLRAPVDWRVLLRTAQREKDARLYSISASGAFLATDRPLMRNALVHLPLPLPTGAIQAAARVVMTNVPGNLQRPNLPVGMGVAFTGTAVEEQASLQLYAEARFRELGL